MPVSLILLVGLNPAATVKDNIISVAFYSSSVSFSNFLVSIGYRYTFTMQFIVL
jgi:hypothetical protein